MRLARAPHRATSRIRVERVERQIICAFCGLEPRGLRIELGHAPTDRDRFDVCLPCAGSMRVVEGREQWSTCQACSAQVKPGRRLTTTRLAFEIKLTPHRLCWPCAARVERLVTAADLVLGTTPYIDWEGVP